MCVVKLNFHKIFIENDDEKKKTKKNWKKKITVNQVILLSADKLVTIQ